MGEVADFFSGIFDTHLWPPRWQCGTWSDFQGWLYISSDVAIWGAYFAIPLLVVNIVSRKKVPFLPVFWLAAGFILFCGFTHLIDAIIFYFPIYRFAAFLRALTAIISWATVYVLYKNLGRVFSLKTPEELQIEVENRRKAEQDLAIRNAELEQSNAELDKLVNSASHDIRAPLTSISGALQVVMEQNTDPKQQEMFRLMENNLRNLDNIIYDITCFSGNKMDSVNLEACTAKYLYDKALDGISPELKSEAVSYFFKDETSGEFMGDQARIIQLLRILLENGGLYRDPEKDSWVKTTISEKENTLKIEVEDNGLGIDPGEGDKIFQMFYRGNIKSQGSGLGLYLLKEILKKLDGKVKYSSTLNEGSTFEIELPK